METTTKPSPSNRPSESAPADVPVDQPRIVVTPEVRGGRPRVAGHRVTVADIAVWHERQGLSPDEIVDQHPSLTLSAVYAALAYYFENREQIDADILEGERRVEELRAGRPSVLQKIRRRAAADAQDDTLPPG